MEAELLSFLGLEGGEQSPADSLSCRRRTLGGHGAWLGTAASELLRYKGLTAETMTLIPQGPRKPDCVYPEARGMFR